METFLSKYFDQNFKEMRNKAEAQLCQAQLTLTQLSISKLLDIDSYGYGILYADLTGCDGRQDTSHSYKLSFGGLNALFMIFGKSDWYPTISSLEIMYPNTTFSFSFFFGNTVTFILS